MLGLWLSAGLPTRLALGLRLDLSLTLGLALVKPLAAGDATWAGLVLGTALALGTWEAESADVIPVQGSRAQTLALLHNMIRAVARPPIIIPRGAFLLSTPTGRSSRQGMQCVPLLACKIQMQNGCQGSASALWQWQHLMEEGLVLQSSSAVVPCSPQQPWKNHRH